jgi:hypothetical protein
MKQERTILELLHIVKDILDNSKEKGYKFTGIIIYKHCEYFGLCGLLNDLVFGNMLEYNKNITIREKEKLFNYLVENRPININKDSVSYLYWFPSSKLKPRQDFINKLIKTITNGRYK